MKDALNLYMEEPEDCLYIAQLPNEKTKKSKTTVSIALDPKIALSFLVRRNRIKQKMTQKEAAKALGFENVYSYQRLETRQCNPTLEIISKLKQVFPEISIDYTIS